MKKSILISIAVLILLTAVLAAVHLTTRTPDSEGEILVNGEAVAIADLPLSPVEGSIVNGKGEKTQINARGISLSELCGGFDEATVTASDEYSAAVGAEEAENAYLILCDDGALQLVVFGDDNQKRCVKNVVRIDTE